jgi:putative heme-binding domain-containing protein
MTASTPRALRLSGAGLLSLGLSAFSVFAQNNLLSDAPPTDEVKAPPGFTVERIYTVPKATQGSWVALTQDPKGRLIASDQYGGLFRITLPPLGTTQGTQVEPLESFGLAGAHGLLWANDSLYVNVSERAVNKVVGGEGKGGVWRLRDTNGDDVFDRIDQVANFEGRGEHGPHALELGPDGRTVYWMNGNFTTPPAYDKQLPKAYGDDHIVPRMWSAGGHARGVLAPGGQAGRMDPDGSNLELFAMGFRNAYSIAFDPNGELFTYDSDMEHDNGSPWYVPTRINHVVSTGDYGWRSGAGRYPAYHADSLPAVVDIGPGSPTGVTFGTGFKAPAKYQHAVYALDWTFGTIYAIHLKPDGASFKGVKEEFITGRPLPVTDLVIDRRDGTMYFSAGGRRTDSALYRVTYRGPESTVSAPYPAPTPTARLRRKLEQLHVDGTPASAINTAWPHLASEDRFIRWAARTAIERQPAALWSARALDESNLQASLEALIALARVGDKALQPRLIAALSRHDLDRIAPELRLPLIRAWELVFTRMGEPAPEVRQQVLARLDPLFPHPDAFVSRELAGLLIYLDSPTVVPKLVPLLTVAENPAEQYVVDESLLARNDRYGPLIAGMNATRPDRQQYIYAYALRSAREGWTPPLREQYFAWFNRAYQWTGGRDFDGFINNIRLIALAGVSDQAERARLAQASVRPASTIMVDVVPPKGPGHDYSIEDATAVVRGHLTGRDFEQGRAMFYSTACVVCHRIGPYGLGSVGPNLTQAGTRYTERDLMEAIIAPSLSVNEGYTATQYELKDGSILVGNPAFDEAGDLYVATSPMQPNDLTLIKTSDILSTRPYEMSTMPPGLINGLNEDELRDLTAFILAAGNSQSPMFKK